jgi:hypothetical protein
VLLKHWLGCFIHGGKDLRHNVRKNKAYAHEVKQQVRPHGYFASERLMKLADYRGDLNPVKAKFAAINIRKIRSEKDLQGFSARSEGERH